MYINGLFLLLFWCLGWSELGFVNGLYLVAVLLLALLVSYTRRKAAFSLTAWRKSRGLAPELDSVQWPLAIVGYSTYGVTKKYAPYFSVNVSFCVDT